MDGDLATLCTVSGTVGITETQACACDVAGVCTAGVTGTQDFNGPASFSYTVFAFRSTSATATATLSITPVDDPPVAISLTPAAFDEDVQSIITLSYTDVEFDQATICNISNLSNVTVTQACTCVAGVCSVGVTGPANYNGIASFDYDVTANGATSGTATASLTVSPVDDAPVTANFSPAAFDEDIQSIISLTYTDVESDLATVCTLTNLSNVTVTQACACVAGVCSVGVTGILNFNGAASFDYSVTGNGQISNASTASLTVNAIDDAPVTANISPVAFNEDTQSIITLSYTDTESDAATVCSISALTNVSVTQPCACAAGVCTVGITGVANYNGLASFNYDVTANGLLSNTVSAALSITPVDDVPVAANITPAAFNEDVQSIVTLSYIDVDTDLATNCVISNLSNITVTQACACAAGVCTVGVTGSPLDYNGVAGFDLTVTANGATSNTASAALTITPVNDAPVAANITPVAFNEDTQSVMTLSYVDVDGDLATTCSLSSLSNVTVTQGCACAAGTCTVGVTGVLNYNGAAGFNYTVTSAGLTSAAATGTFTINPVDDAPISSCLLYTSDAADE